jgi:hypothetical protein
VDFGELNDKAIKGLMLLSKIVSRFSLYIHELLLKYFKHGCILWFTSTKISIWCKTS